MKKIIKITNEYPTREYNPVLEKANKVLKETNARVVGVIGDKHELEIFLEIHLGETDEDESKYPTVLNTSGFNR